MKKVLSLILALALCLSCSLALAEATVVDVDPIADGAVVPFEDYGFTLTLPSDWNVLAVTDEQAATGIIAAYANAEGTRTFTVAYNELADAIDMATLQSQLTDAYANVSLMTINGTDFVTYEITDLDQAGLAFLGGEGTGLYLFVFTPNSDSEYGALACQIAGSIAAIEE